MSSTFKISVPEDSISSLKQKLELTRLPDELDEARWDYGVPLSDIRRLVARWKDGYDWKRLLHCFSPAFSKFLNTGRFELGFPQMYDGAVIVERSIALGQPAIYVSMNYQVTKRMRRRKR
ncbi:hypothetical protein E1B28_009463 [Marasmius oreades]|uniref:Epoxide hydrolase N-terminal domain-containing protein n=1 Tax=Marasmius oreades TaxID=181124 RepID=A0A9P7RWK8_9AGAR|nr:uncharacterized protein E1B28_009463 [Marasmius oreades]KAG7090343.1 hypothetical protein E1B28_009463 [Marasmius oreades]